MFQPDIFFVPFYTVATLPTYTQRHAQQAGNIGQPTDIACLAGPIGMRIRNSP